MPARRTRKTSSHPSLAEDLRDVAAATAREPWCEAVVRTALVQAHAQTAYLVLCRADGYGLLAEAGAREHRPPEIRVHSEDVQAAATLPSSLLDHVARARQTLVIDDAATPHRFTGDTGFAGRRPRSVLCVPLVPGADTLALLYLEHAGAPGCFTPTRVARLERLAAQAAMSLVAQVWPQSARAATAPPMAERISPGSDSPSERRHADAEPPAHEATLTTDRILLRTVIDNIPDQIFVKDAHSRIIIGNKAQAACVGVASPEELTGKSDLDLYPTHIGRMFFDDEQRLMHAGQALIDQVELNVNQAGVKRWFYVTKVPLRDERQHVVGLVGIARDITERIEAEKALRLRNRAIELSVDAIVMTDCSRPNHAIEFVNPAFERISGYSAEEAREHGVDLLLGKDADAEGAEIIRAALREQRAARTVLRNQHRDGNEYWADLFVSPVHDGSGEVTHFVWMIRDITESRNYQEQLKHLASYDALTGLPNRRMLMDLLTQSVALAKRSGHRVAVAFFDLDRFKLINDSLGHGAGDELLLQVARRVRACVRRSDSVGRLGGDEFVVLLPESGNEPPSHGGPGATASMAVNLGIIEVLKRIRAAVAEPVLLAGREVRVSCSVGVSFFPADGGDAETLLKNADAAMYRAKEKGGDAIELYTVEMNAQVTEQLTIECMLRNALERDEFSLVYQPRVNLSTGCVSGVEAQLRWNNPERGAVAPSVFIPVLERSGIINAVGKWVMREAIASLSHWRTRGLTPPRITVNVSQIQLDQKSFVEDVQLALGSCADPALDLEITESLIMRNVGANLVKLRAIRELGVGIAIDDFGTSHSSLSHLGCLPVNALKIDRAFIDAIATGAEGLKIVSAMVSLAHSMHLSAIAEGVETEQQRDLLRQLGCDEIQGDLLGPPLSLEALIDWHTRWEAARLAAQDPNAP